MLPSHRPEPRITVNELALYMVSSETARFSIVKRSKFPSTPPLIRYKDVRPVIASYLADMRREVQTLTQAEAMFAHRAQDASQGSLRKDDARQSIEVLHAIQGMGNKLAGLRFSAAPRSQPSLKIAGVEVACRLDLFAHGSSRGVEQTGGVVLRLTQDDTETEVAKKKRREMGHCVATIAQMHMERNFTQQVAVANRLCMSIDVRHGEVFPAPASNTRRIGDIEVACRFIAALWPTLKLKLEES